MVKICTIFILFVTITASNLFSQYWPDTIDITEFTGFQSYRMGELKLDYVPKNINVRTNKFIEKHLKPKDYSLRISNPFFYFDILSTNNSKIENPYIKISPTDLQEVNKKSVVNFDLLSTKTSSKAILSLGKSNLHPPVINKIQHLYLIPELGIPDLSTFNNLKSISLDDYHNEFTYLNFYTDSRKYSYTSYYKYIGDLNLLNEISRKENLNFLKLNFRRNLIGMMASDNIFLANELNEDIFNSGNLQNLSLTGIQFLPIDYINMKNLKFIEISGVYFPELLNLSLLFLQEKKDTSEGNWHFLLKNLVDEEKSVINISNGQVRTLYKNGQLLSEGEMINDKPDGEWKFWYPNGKLCEERHYKNGVRTGKWTFRNPSDYSIDTALILEFNNGNLVNRKDFSIEYTNPKCCTIETPSSVHCSSELIIHVSAVDSTNISIKRRIGKREILETLSSNNQYWKYEEIEKCDEQIMYEVKFSGEKNEISNYLEIKTFSWSQNKLINQTFYSVDLLNCNVHHILYKVDWKSQKVEIIQDSNSKILPEYWNCDN